MKPLLKVKKSLGQNFLVDNNIIKKIVDIGNERLNVLKYFLFSIENIEPGSFLSVNTDYQEYLA